MIPKTPMAGHPDKVFGPDVTDHSVTIGVTAPSDDLSSLVNRLRETNMSDKYPVARALIADGLHAAAQRIVHEFDKLRAARDQLVIDDQAVRAREAAVEVRELAVQSRETLLGLYDPPPVTTKVSAWGFFKRRNVGHQPKSRKEPKA